MRLARWCDRCGQLLVQSTSRLGGLRWVHKMTGAARCAHGEGFARPEERPGQRTLDDREVEA